MQTMTQDVPLAGELGPAHARAGHRAGVILSGLATAFLLMDGVAKLLELPPVIEGTVQLGYPREIVFSLGAVQLACVVLYLLPRTSVLGAVLLTGYLGGAVATHARLAHPLVSHTLFPTYVAAFVWGGLVLRDPRLRALLPLRRES